MKAFIDQIMGLSYEEMMDLNEEKLEKMGVTKVPHLKIMPILKSHQRTFPKDF